MNDDEVMAVMKDAARQVPRVAAWLDADPGGRLAAMVPGFLEVMSAEDAAFLVALNAAEDEAAERMREKRRRP